MIMENKIVTGSLVLFVFSLFSLSVTAQHSTEGSVGNSYPGMPLIAPIGARIEKYITVNESAKGPAIDPAKGYRVQELGKGLYMVTDNIYQSMFLVYEKGVVHCRGRIIPTTGFRP